jgi:hypothetical protein
MKLGFLAASAVLALVTFDVDSAEAGKKGRQGHGSSGKVHISPTVSDKNLELVKKKLHGDQKRAVQHEINRRDRRARRSRETGEAIGTLPEIGLQILNLRSATGRTISGH